MFKYSFVKITLHTTFVLRTYRIESGRAKKRSQLTSFYSVFKYNQQVIQSLN